MSSNKNPMPLSDLPEYLRSIRENGQTGVAPVVDIGHIQIDEYKYPWKRMIFSLFIFCALTIGGISAYNSSSVKEYTLVVDLNDNTDAFTRIPEMMSENGGEILSVSQKEGSTYIVKISTRKNKKIFLEWLNKNKNINKANVEE